MVLSSGLPLALMMVAISWGFLDSPSVKLNRTSLV
jgi:hypothetical protein